ncbi:hypothetical protein MT340_005320 [Staphylococcus sp. NRL 16/872]|uniref:hypothetical protein n=1 Tax=Staphylococcus sp. NRL 16/872 TaxID=2930131 RepID=UPI001FB1CEDE|nr:hypothetical protein [Staphylococcus sp. NRL 16/872]WEN70332.1 hypothetical protein MT340_005320 [Staphylococcus sp. NRL 16/872]
MTIETERIYEITRDKFHGVVQGTERNYRGDYIICLYAVIEWNDGIETVKPHQVKFKEDE